MACATFVRRFLIWTLLLGSAAADAQSISLTKVSGDGQLVVQQVGVSAPLVVLVRDASGNPVPNVKVVWTVNTAQLGIISPAIPDTKGATVPGTTDAKGQSSATFIADLPPVGNSILQGTVSASYSGQSVTFTVTSVGETITGVPNVQAFPTPLPSTALSAASGQQSGSIAVQFKIVGGPQNGTNVQNAALTLSLDNPNNPSTAACVGGNTQLSVSTNGIATCKLVFGGKVGQGSFNISAANLQNFDYKFIVTAGPPDIISFPNGNTISGIPGQLTVLTAQVSDIGGNPLANVPMTWTPQIPGSVTLSNTRTQTDATGRISTNVTLGNVSGAVPVVLSTASGTTTQTGQPISATFNITVNVVVKGLNQVGNGNNQSALENAPFANPLEVEVVDANGNPVAGATVTFNVTSGSAILGSPTVITGVDGLASTSVVAGASAGAVVITASTVAAGTTYSAQPFNLTVTPPGPVCDANLANQDTFLNGASFAPNFMSPGGIALIYCNGIADTIQGVVRGSDLGFGPLPLQVAGVTVQFEPPNGPYAPIYYVANEGGKEKVAIQVPFNILGTNPTGTPVPVVVTANGEANVGGPLMPQIWAAAPGFIEWTQSDGVSRAILVRENGEFINVDTPGHMAKPGETLRAFVTGLIPPMTASGTSEIGTDEFAPAGSDITITTPIIMGIAHKGIGKSPITAIYAHDLIGIWEVTFVVPTNAASGIQSLDIGVPDPTNNNKTILNRRGSKIPIQ